MHSLGAPCQILSHRLIRREVVDQPTTTEEELVYVLLGPQSVRIPLVTHNGIMDIESS